MRLPAEDRACLGAFTAFWFTLGTVLFPALHLAGHENDHSHGALSTGAGVHRHGPDEEAHTHAAGPEDPDSAPLDADHGKGSLSHFAASIAADAVLVSPSCHFVARPLPLGKRAVHRPAPLERADARGPPPEPSL